MHNNLIQSTSECSLSWIFSPHIFYLTDKQVISSVNEDGCLKLSNDEFKYQVMSCRGRNSIVVTRQSYITWPAGEKQFECIEAD